MSLRIKVRGIYSTALTQFSLNSGFEIVDPSQKIRERFILDFSNRNPDIFIHDRDDLQGIKLEGEADGLSCFLSKLGESLPDPVIINFSSDEDHDGKAIADLELPGGSKEKLDDIRSLAVPTLKNHHRLKIINGTLLALAESQLAKEPGSKAELERKIMREVVLEPLDKAGVVRVEHIRPSGKSMRPREGAIQAMNEGRIVFKRSFSAGRYDGLDLIIRKGDYGLSEIRDGSWYLRHSYYSKEHLLLGEYFNINTPVELYPYGARYIDLEVDVIRRAGEEAFVIDREKLGILSRKGCISKELEAKALLVAEQILRVLSKQK